MTVADKLRAPECLMFKGNPNFISARKSLWQAHSRAISDKARAQT